jgi:hypothetical protein
MRKQHNRRDDRKKSDIIQELRAIINKLRKENKILREEVERLKLMKETKKPKVKKPQTAPPREKTEQEKKEEWRKDFIKRWQDKIKGQ